MLVCRTSSARTGVIPQRWRALSNRAGFWQLRVKIGSIRHVAAVAHCGECRLNLLDRQLRHLGIAAPLGEQ
jgi:hypothetical protein